MLDIVKRLTLCHIFWKPAQTSDSVDRVSITYVAARSSFHDHTWSMHVWHYLCTYDNATHA